MTARLGKTTKLGTRQRLVQKGPSSVPARIPREAAGFLVGIRGFACV
jgi:hypothetical protein